MIRIVIRMLWDLHYFQILNDDRWIDYYPTRRSVQWIKMERNTSMKKIYFTLNSNPIYNIIYIKIFQLKG